MGYLEPQGAVWSECLRTRSRERSTDFIPYRRSEKSGSRVVLPARSTVGALKEGLLFWLFKGGSR